MFISTLGRPCPISTCITQMPRAPACLLSGIAFFCFGQIINFHHHTYTKNVRQLLEKNDCQQALEAAQAQGSSDLLEEVAFSKCGREFRNKALSQYSYDLDSVIIFDQAMEALERNDCEELTVSQPFTAMPLIDSIWNEKIKNGLCLESYPKNSLEIEANLKHFKTQKKFEAFKKYFSDKNWIAVARIARDLKYKNDDLSEEQKKELRSGLTMLLEKDTVSLGLKEYIYWTLVSGEREKPENLEKIRDSLKNHFLEKGDHSRAERIASIN